MAELHVYADTVPDGGYSTIQDAIDASAPGDTIIVHPGTYSENLVMKTTDVTLISSDGPAVTTILPADPELDTIRISGADGTTIQGFAIVGGTNPQTNAVHVHGIDDGYDLASDITITGNVITRGEGDGIKLSKVSDIVIDGNTITGGGDRESGIDLVGGERIVITNNTLLDMGYVGISLKGGSTDLIVQDNVIDGAAHTGIEIGGYTNLANYIPGFLEVGNTYEISNVLVSGNQVNDAKNGAYRVIGGQNIAFVNNTATGNGAVVKIDDSALFHDVWYSDNIDFSGNSFEQDDWLKDRSDQATITYDGSPVFEPWLDDTATPDPVTPPEPEPTPDPTPDPDPTPEPTPDPTPEPDTQIDGTGQGDAITTTDAGDLVYGYAGDDTLDGLGGNDSLYGGADRDTIFGGDGDDDLFGQNGRDRLYGGSGADRLSGGDEDDRLMGGLGDDILMGDDGRDTLEGGAGNDTLDGGAGRDRLDGGTGDDVLIAGTGEADLAGGEDADTFVFDFAANLDAARIRDLNVDEGDVIVMTGFAGVLDSFDDLDTNGNGVLDNGDTGVTVENQRTTLDFNAILGNGVWASDIEIEGSTLTADAFAFL